MTTALQRRVAAGRKAHRVRARMDAQRATRPTARQCDYLRAIAWSRQRTTEAIAAHLEVGVHAAGEMIRRLERAGWTERLPGPRRARLVHLTGRGAAVLFHAATVGFATEMREQGIHVGIGSPPRCVVCDVPYPCEAASGSASSPPCLADVGATGH